MNDLRILELLTRILDELVTARKEREAVKEREKARIMADIEAIKERSRIRESVMTAGEIQVRALHVLHEGLIWRAPNPPWWKRAWKAVRLLLGRRLVVSGPIRRDSDPEVVQRGRDSVPDAD